MAGTTYLQEMTLPPQGKEIDFLWGQKMTCYNNAYPFQVFPPKQVPALTFAPVTIFYGGNGSGKTTLLNIIAEKLRLQRHSAFNGSAFFGDYVAMCEIKHSHIPEGSQILTSDDVSDYLLNIRYLNDGIDTRRNELLQEYTDRRFRPHQLKSLEEYDDWKISHDAKSRTKSGFVNDRLRKNIDMFSNGETAMHYYLERITENALYLIDEPENSLSAQRQLELRGFLADSARFFGCQFVMATHAPFLLSIPGARIYDLDDVPVRTKRWTELENVRTYFTFFMENQHEFF